MKNVFMFISFCSLLGFLEKKSRKWERIIRRERKKGRSKTETQKVRNKQMNTERKKAEYVYCSLTIMYTCSTNF